ncbi:MULTISPECIES: hypothetical protein [Leptospira]|uniref:Tetratricopeptide repeat protein n=3 Tax=Leptospira weilii TaxID=28184 RepID=N1UAA0_9LEPT|nr:MULTISPECIES: hypothetical protein [Leptospira]EMM73345.1 hypothetical protein LEP1GSC038_2522 [Leptospira weilii str. 2006001855]EMY16012.1 hypothetical protein LEP1GSC043_4359 [Leptospira weilii str. Ecochallenge]EMJ66606.1 hypothetical protein LEP1GSC051_4471 [Leptospira sp. P2653]EMN44862.1 hypothetical protein LEP1GSC086_0653 [Leptospira weilii str. LNT 1234]EMN88014.1 hypothetical protein LEP1GSC108_0842 [Leptospira weilii str. UI 13098]
MLYQSGLKSYKKKTSYKPYILVALMLILGGTGFFFQQSIKNLFAGDRKILLEKERKNIQQQIHSGTLEEGSVKNFQNAAKDYVHANPSDELGYFYIALGNYNSFLLNGFSFDSGTLVKLAYSGFNDFLKEDESYLPILEEMYRNALRAKAIDPAIGENPDNEVMIAFGETVKQHLSKKSLTHLLNSIPYDKISPEFKISYTWIAILGASLSGDTEFLKRNLASPESSGSILLTEREALFLIGLSEFRAGQYVSSLNFIRKVRNENEDFITIGSWILEAKIFRLQNLHAKSIAILEELYPKVEERREDIIRLVKEIIDEKPTLKTKLDLESTR